MEKNVLELLDECEDESSVVRWDPNRDSAVGMADQLTAGNC